MAESQTKWWGSVVVTVCGEPLDRLERMVAALGNQDIAGPMELVIAAPPEDLDALHHLVPCGAVGRIVLIPNPGGKRSAGLNRAVAAATSEIVHRIDARSSVPPHYLRVVRKRLDEDPAVGVVGGHQRPVAPPGSGPWARGVARALANPVASGGALYRRVGAGGPVDTVYLGSFRKAQLLEAGGYDERLDANEDFELCQRLRERGLVVWLESGLAVGYEARSSLSSVWRQYDTFGRAKMRYWRLHHALPNRRQFVGLAAPVLAAAGIVALLATLRDVRAALGLGAVGVAALAAVDHIVGEKEPAPPTARLSAALGAVVMPAAWATGVYREFLARR